MINRFQLNKLDNLLFYIGYIPVLIMGILSSSAFIYSLPIEKVNKAIVAFSIVLFLLKTIINEYQIKEFFIYFVLLIVFVVSAYQSRSTTVFTMFLFMMSSRNVNPKVINKIFFVISSVLLIAIVLASLKGIIPNFVYYRDGLSRASLGIIYPTDFASHVFYLMCSYAFLRKDKFGLKDVIFIGAVSYWVYSKTNARLNFVCSILLILGMLFVRFNKKNLVKKFTWLSPALGATIMIYLTYIYSPANSLTETLNKLLSGRLSIVNELMGEYGFKLFGSNVAQNGLGGPTGLNFNNLLTKYIFIDSTYLRLLMMYGIITLILVLVFLTVMLKKIDEKYLLVILLVIFISGAIENHLLELAYNPFLIILFSEYLREKIPNKIVTECEPI